ncbi:MAG TPA: hypothetical protein VH301_14690 [Usitatibacter sp.]|jgi:hypothetical protein|nr:hypothetical protein [Usitatibacter sp.]
MSSRYNAWAVVLAICLELGIFGLYCLNVIGIATTASCGFAVGAVLVTALMLGGPFANESEGRTEKSRK